MNTRTETYIIRRSPPPPPFAKFLPGDVISSLNGKFIANAEQRAPLIELLRRVCGDINEDRIQIGDLQRLLDEGYIRVYKVHNLTARHLSVLIL